MPVDTTTNALWAGYTYAPGHSGEVATGVVMVDPALVLKLYYTANSDTPYVVYRYQLDGNGVFTQLTSENYTGYTDDLVSTTPNVPAGYQLVPDGTGAFRHHGRPADDVHHQALRHRHRDGKLVLVHVFQAIQVRYVVNYWKIPGSALGQSDPLSYKAPAAPSQTFYDFTGVRVTAVAPSIPGYTYILPSAHREMYPSVDTGVVLGNGTLVLNLYYEADYHTLTLVPDTGAGAGNWAPGYSGVWLDAAAQRDRDHAAHH